MVLNGDEWVFGIGVTMEIGENSFPKTNLVIPVSTVHRGDEIIVTAPIVNGEHSFPSTGDFHDALDSFVAEFANGLEEVVERWAKGQTTERVGFATVEK